MDTIRRLGASALCALGVGLLLATASVQAAGPAGSAGALVAASAVEVPIYKSRVLNRPGNPGGSLV